MDLGNTGAVETRGIYVLLISLGETRRLNVGSLGAVVFERGLYAYVGSAQSGLEKRILRHLSSRKKIFWHIDYLLSNESAKVTGIFLKAAPRIEECRVAKVIGESNKPINGFGSSDCNCRSHLFKIDNCEIFRMLLMEMGFNPVSAGSGQTLKKVIGGGFM